MRCLRTLLHEETALLSVRKIPFPELTPYSAPTIEVGRITKPTLDELDAESRKAGKPLTFREAEKVLQAGSVMELQAWRNRLFAQFEDAWDLLVPHPADKRVERAEMLATAKIDPFTL